MLYGPCRVLSPFSLLCIHCGPPTFTTTRFVPLFSLKILTSRTMNCQQASRPFYMYLKEVIVCVQNKERKCHLHKYYACLAGYLDSYIFPCSREISYMESPRTKREREKKNQIFFVTLCSPSFKFLLRGAITIIVSYAMEYYMMSWSESEEKPV